jgi:hypothetical protein
MEARLSKLQEEGFRQRNCRSRILVLQVEPTVFGVGVQENEGASRTFEIDAAIRTDDPGGDGFHAHRLALAGNQEASHLILAAAFLAKDKRFFLNVSSAW